MLVRRFAIKQEVFPLGSRTHVLVARVSRLCESKKTWLDPDETVQSLLQLRSGDTGRSASVLIKPLPKSRLSLRPGVVV